MTGAPFPRRPNLRLVPAASPPRPRRIDVRLSVADGRSPIGRSRAFRLHDHELDELIACALRLEART
jgi:hypothetical protein